MPFFTIGMNLPFLRNIENLKGKRVILRLDLNVSIKDGYVFEDFRIKKIIPTLEYLTSKGAKTVIIAHLDKKEGKSLEPVARYLFPFFPKLRFLPDLYSNEAKEEWKNLPEGGLILFENIRNWKGEEENNPVFAEYLASFGECYVNDAFSVSHRNHASIVGVTEFLPSYLGPLFEEEIKNLSKAFDPSHPFLFILGGAKFETKIPLLEKFLPLADKVFVGGAIANDFFKAQGNFVGDSLVSETNIDLSKFLSNEKIILPVDCRTQHKGFRYTKKPSEISVGEKIWDAGEKTAKNISKLIKEASFIVWNGPLGNIEVGAKEGTIEFAKMIASSNATSIVGGGDTITALEKTEYFNKFTFVSSGGGAMLDFLANETLPGIEAIKKQKHPPKIPKPASKKSWLKKIFS